METGSHHVMVPLHARMKRVLSTQVRFGGVTSTRVNWNPFRAVTQTFDKAKLRGKNHKKTTQNKLENHTTHIDSFSHPYLSITRDSSAVCSHKKLIGADTVCHDGNLSGKRTSFVQVRKRSIIGRGLRLKRSELRNRSRDIASYVGADVPVLRENKKNQKKTRETKQSIDFSHRAATKRNVEAMFR